MFWQKCPPIDALWDWFSYVWQFKYLNSDQPKKITFTFISAHCWTDWFPQKTVFNDSYLRLIMSVWVVSYLKQVYHKMQPVNWPTRPNGHGWSLVLMVESVCTSVRTYVLTYVRVRTYKSTCVHAYKTN